MELDKEEQEFWNECLKEALVLFVKHTPVGKLDDNTHHQYMENSVRMADAMIKARREALKELDLD